MHKKSLKVWDHIATGVDDFFISGFYFKRAGNVFQIVELGGSNRRKYELSEITVFDDTDGGVPETFTNATDLELRLEQLRYPGFFQPGEVNIADYISPSPGNGLTLVDGLLYVSSAGSSARAYLELRIIEKGIYNGIPNNGGSNFPADLQKGDFVAGRKDIHTYWDRAMYIGDDPTDRENCYEQLAGGGPSIIP